MTLDIEAALEALRTGEESVRRETVELLAASGSERAIKPLLVAVGDESWPVRQASAERLAAFDPALLLPVLEGALRDEEDAAIRNAAMEIYVKMGAAAIAPLLRLLADRDEEVRNFAAVMLGTVRDARAVPALVRALCRSRRQRPPRGRCQPGSDRLPRGRRASGPCASNRAVAPVPRHQRPGRDRRPAGGAGAARAAGGRSPGRTGSRGPRPRRRPRRPEAPHPVPLRLRHRHPEPGDPRGGGHRAARHGERREPRSRGPGGPAPGGPRRPPARRP